MIHAKWCAIGTAANFPYATIYSDKEKTFTST